MLKACGVITDSLGNVQATTRDGNRRLAVHHERGARAGCWGVEDATPFETPTTPKPPMPVAVIPAAPSADPPKRWFGL